MTRKVPLSRGLYALVDEADFDHVMQWRWYARPALQARRNFYVYRTLSGAKPKTLYLHRFLVDAERGFEVDHINGNGLDNRRDNLRKCSKSLNNANRKATLAASGYRGVYPQAGGPRWAARISTGSRRYKWLGSYVDPVEAAKAYDAAARALFGDFATLNFPEAAPHARAST